MKKSLIALAVLAASGASFAQVTMTGNLAMGYMQTTTGASGGTGSKDASGFGTDWSQINFAAVEDLGGGMKITAKMALAGADRSGESGTGAVTGNDASLTVATSMGSLALATARAGDYLTAGTAGVGAYYNGFDGKIFNGKSNRDTVTYTLPVGPVSVGLSYQETAAGLGIGSGTQGDAPKTLQRRNVLSVMYASGPIVVDGAFLSYNLSGAAGETKDLTRLSGSYDLGSAKIGVGTEFANFSGTMGRRADYLIGLIMPLGALTFGTQMAMRDQQDAGAIPFGTATAESAPGSVAGITRGTNIYANYALSKRTSIYGQYLVWTRNSGDGASNQFLALLAHSF